MTTIAKITKAYVRTYSDNQTTRSYVEWIDTKGVEGRTEGAVPLGTHMLALFERAKREGVTPIYEQW
jgi:hypothetical protein